MKRFLLVVPLLALCLCSCEDFLIPSSSSTEDNQATEETRLSRQYANLFAYGVMHSYYLWEKEVADRMKSWTFEDDPVQKVKDVRYEADHWTQMVEDYNAFVGSVSGNTRSMGFDFVLYYADSKKKDIVMVVTFTYADSPASQAGLKRGDAIKSLNGKTLTIDNYASVIMETVYGGGTVQLKMTDGRDVSLTAVEMYEDPVNAALILGEYGGKKVGYLHYASFTLDSCLDLENVFRGFKANGVQELVLDLRYNGGGYVIAGQVLASMIAPAAAVEAGSIFNRDEYNSILTEAWGESTTPFVSELTFSNQGKQQTVHPGEVNLDLSRVWVITSGNTASASESLICGLKPYMDVVVVGDRTAGKFCGGFIIDAKSWYESARENDKEQQIDYEEALGNCGSWGIYVMVSRYADCNGVTLSMPDGIAPDITITDDPADGFALGSPQETILATVLSRMSGASLPSKAAPGLAPAPSLLPAPWRPERPGRILPR